MTTRPPDDLSFRLAAWSGAPKFDESKQKAERESISLAEITAALQDVSFPANATGAPAAVGGEGTSDEIANHVPPPRRLISEEDLEQLESAIGKCVPRQEREAYLEARDRAPDVVREESELFLATIPEDNGDIDDLAKKMCRYWVMRRQVFGPDKACLPTTLAGAFRDDVDESLKNVDFAHVLPGAEDRYGRTLFYNYNRVYDLNRHDRYSVFRAVWYMWEAALRTARIPVMGAVLVINWDYDAKHLDRKIVKLLFDFHNYFPLKLRAVHFVRREKPWFADILMPGIRFLMGRDLRQRLRLHYGTHEKILTALATYGIDSEMLPSDIGGSHTFDLGQWIDDRKVGGL